MAIEKISTVGMSRDKWLEIRRESIGGSDAGALLGLNPFKSPYALWAEKTGKAIPEDISDKEAVRLGNDLEEYVAQRFTEATGKKVRRCNAIIKNADYPFAHANPDRLVVGEDSGLECKTTSSWETLKKCREGEFPDTWYSQCVHYMMVTGAKKWYLAVLCFGHGFFWFEIERDDAEIAALAKAEAEFWQKVQSKTEPPVDGAESTGEALKVIYADSNGRKCDLFPVSTNIQMLQQLKVRAKEIDRMIAEQQNIICSYMGHDERGEYGNTRITWKSQSRRSFDTKRFAADHPNLFLEPYYKESSFRTFKITEVKEA